MADFEGQPFQSIQSGDSPRESLFAEPKQKQKKQLNINYGTPPTDYDPQIAQLRSELAETKRELQTAQQQIANNTRRITGQDTRIALLENKQEGLEKKIFQIVEEQQRQAERISEGEKRLGKVEDTAQKALEATTRLNTLFDQLSQQVNQNTAAITLNTQAIKELTARVETIESVLDQYKTQITELFNNLENLRTSVGELTQQVNQNTMSIAENRQAIQGFQDQLGQIQSTIDDHSKQINDIGNLALQNQRAINEVKGDYSSLRLIVNSIQASLNQLVSNFGDVNARLLRVEGQLENLEQLYGTQITQILNELRCLGLQVSGHDTDIKKILAELLELRHWRSDSELQQIQLNNIVRMLQDKSIVYQPPPRRPPQEGLQDFYSRSSGLSSQDFKSVMAHLCNKASTGNRISPEEINLIYEDPILRTLVIHCNYEKTNYRENSPETTAISQFTTEILERINNFNVNVNVGILAFVFGAGRNNDKDLEMYLKVFITLLWGLTDDSVSRAELKEFAEPLLLQLIDKLYEQKGHSLKKSNFLFLVDAACAAIGTTREKLLENAPNLERDTGFRRLS